QRRLEPAAASDGGTTRARRPRSQLEIHQGPIGKKAVMTTTDAEKDYPRRFTANSGGGPIGWLDGRTVPNPREARRGRHGRGVSRPRSAAPAPRGLEVSDRPG